MTQFPAFVISKIMPTSIHIVCLSSCCLIGLLISFAVYKATFHCSLLLTMSYTVKLLSPSPPTKFVPKLYIHVGYKHVKCLDICCVLVVEWYHNAITVYPVVKKPYFEDCLFTLFLSPKGVCNIRF